MIVDLANKTQFRKYILSSRKGPQESRLFFNNAQATGKMPMLHPTTPPAHPLPMPARLNFQSTAA